MTPSKRIIGLDIARSIAILGVLLAHFTQKFHHIKAVYLVANFAGVLGVQLFFVLSGFLIGGILLRQLKREGFTYRDVVHFWKRRWYRTLPNYMACLVAMIVLDKVLYNAMQPKRTLILFPFFLQNFFNPTPIIQFFQVSWSLSVEEWAYITLPLLLIAACVLFSRSALRPRAALMTIAIMILAPLAARLLTSIGLPWDAYARKLVVYRLDSIGYGVLLAYISTFRSDLMRRIATDRFFVLGVSLVLLMWANMAYVWQDRTRIGIPFTGLNAYWMNGFWSVVVDIGMVLMIARFSTVAALPEKRRLWTAFFLACSAWSYSLYLWHPLVLDGVEYLWQKRHLSESTAAYLFQIVLFAILSAGISWFVYTNLEKPIMALRERNVKEKAAP